MVMAAVAATAGAQSGDGYLKLRKTLGISQPVGVEALETLLGQRTVEVKGVVKGTVQVATGGSCVLLEKSDGSFMFVNTTQDVAWLSGNEVPVRLLVKAERETEEGELKANLLGAAPEHLVASLEREAAAKLAAKKAATTSRATMATNKAWSTSATEALPIYARFIRGYNRRLSEKDSLKIAEGVISNSLRYGVDARLIMAMLIVESGFNPSATSRSGAMGLGQLMPSTARGMGVTNAYDTQQNLYGTVRLIRGHLDKYSRRADSDFNHLALALAAYNAGPGAVRKHGGVPPYRETRNYVAKVTAIYQKLQGA